ncbi:hypothetical protein BGZ76_001267 [Entomortierella beljakovae]|nr:hypothetical protein BGZ76_001267 [Entomortierella beljakovae]
MIGMEVIVGEEDVDEQGEEPPCESSLLDCAIKHPESTPALRRFLDRGDRGNDEGDRGETPRDGIESEFELDDGEED